MATTLATQLVLDALNMALVTRRPKQVIHHSDQGSQYTSIAFGQRCRRGRRASLDGLGRRCLRQRHVRKASSQPWNASCSIAAGSRHMPRRQVLSSNSSRASTIHDAATHRSDICHRSTTSAGITLRQLSPTRASVPSCSRPSRTSPAGGRRMRPSLTAAVRDRRTTVRGRDGRMAPPEAELKNVRKQEGNMPSDQIA